MPAKLAIMAVLLIVAVGLRMGGLVQTARLNMFSVDMARSIAGDADESVDLSLILPETNRLLGMLALKKGDTARVDNYFEKAIEGSANMVPLVRAARPNDEALARAAYRLYPSAPDSPGWVGDILATTEPEQAIPYYRQAAALAPLDNLTWEKLGLLAQDLGQNDIALDALSRACDINPIRNGACMRAARLNYDKGEWERVIYYFVRGHMPDSPPDWVLMIKAAEKLGHTTEADGYLVHAQAADPADYETLLAEQP